MQFTALSALVAFALALGTEAAAFTSASTVTIAIPSSADHHGHGASSFASSAFASSSFATPTFAFPTTIAPSSAPTFVPGGNGAFICFPVASGFAVPDLNGTIIFPNGGSGATATAFPSSAFATGTAVASTVFATGTAAGSSAFGSAAPSFATGTAFGSAAPSSSAFASGSAAASAAPSSF